MQPYLQAVTSNSVYVMIECNTADTVIVNFGFTSSFGSSAKTSLISSTTNTPVTYVHKVQLTGLLADTFYYYKATQGSSVSGTSTFHTLCGLGSSYRIAWMADCRTGTSYHDQISTLIGTYNPLFSLYGGDYCSDPSYSSWKSEFFRTNELDLISLVPFFAAIGNHEGWKINTRAFTRSPASSSLTQDYYSFDCGDVHFLCINNLVSDSLGSAQYNFALSDLSSSTKTWKIVYCHFPAYCSGGHGEDQEMITMSQNIFVPQNVDIVVAGHSHFYQHNYVDGIHHMIIGDAGAPQAVPGYAPYTVLSVMDYEFGIIDFTSSSLTLRVFNNLNQLIDSIKLIKPPAVSGPISGIKTVGPAPSDFLSLTQAMNYLRTKNNGVNGALILELKSNYSGNIETFPLTINAVTGVSSSNTITIRPQAGASGLSISGNNSTGTLNLNGITNLIIDGRPGGAGTSQLTIGNQSTAGFAIQFINDASDNTVRCCTINGVCSSTTAGIVFFSTTTLSAGNDNNLIDQCIIRDGLTVPSNLVYSRGTSGKENSGNTISACELMNFSNAGIYLSSTGNGNNWAVNGNSIYSTIALTPVAGQLIGIRFGSTTATGNVISGNFIGGQSAYCGGSRWALSTNDPFYGIWVARADIEKNKLSNIGSTISGGTPTIYGIYYSGAAGAICMVSNNMIALDGGIATNPVIYGYYDNASAGGTIYFYYNSINIFGPATTTSSTYAFRHRSASTAIHTLKNNILSNNRISGGSGSHYAIYWGSTGSLLSDYNDLYSLAGPLGNYNAVNQSNLSNWQSASGGDMNSVSDSPSFISSSDLHIAWDPGLNDKGTVIPAVTGDYDGNTRGNPPDPGINEFSLTRTWVGLFSSDWNDPGNWTPYGIPVPVQNIIIPGGIVNNPVINSNGVSCNDLTVNSGGILTISQGKDFTVNGNLTIQEQGTLVNSGNMIVHGSIFK